ncbi:mannosylphosphorylation protein (Mnn4), putative [Paecilomyces variotii No. 5]|uniref:Mannosylphosphorylation protein (Mnn4), putative n=1 Tax=Byssochlamys spectabilis (strain No. 5 / NBRC 109023) TaxID=1356009 RepID=V5FYI4_BYSSN|nr:mannosylphosphorylation protein (Mnn4), putative [Paecilomyces variotii No. 5]
MRLLRVCALLTAAFGLVRGDADFMSVRTSLAKDYSGKGGDPGEKYFHESTFHPHYDGRFASEALPETESLPHLTALMQTYLSTMADLGAETWIMHGTLLGWWWNQKILPWDSDLDVQVSEPTMHFLAEYYNMTEHHFNLPGIKGGRTYMLEVNPHYTIRSTHDTLNVIDARWIDTSSGLFIDITTVRANDEARQRGRLGALICKDRHQYDETDIFPLRDSLFEGVIVKIPYEYTKLLEEEYGTKALTVTEFEGHKWNEETKLWVPDPDAKKKFSKRSRIFRATEGIPTRSTPLNRRLRR